MTRRAVVVGAGQGGLSAAIHLRLKGWDVTMLEARDRVGGKAASLDVEGYRLDPGPSIVILPDIYREVFRAAGRDPDAYLRFQRLAPITRVYLEGEPPLDLPADRSAALNVVRNVSPRDAEALAKLLTTMDRVWPRVRRSVFAKPFRRWYDLLNLDLAAFGFAFDVRKPYRQLIDEWFESSFLRAFFYGFPSYSGQTYRKPSPGALTIPYLMLQEGVWWPEGGIGQIPASFARLAQELGVEIRTGARVARWNEEGGQVRSVTLESGEEVTGDAFFSNRDRLTTETDLGRAPDVPPSYSYFTLHYGAPSRIQGLAHHTLLIPKDFERGFEALYDRREFPDPPIVYLNETAGTDPSTAPPGGTNLFAVVTVPAEEPHLDWSDPKYIEGTERVMSHFGFPPPPDAAFRRVQTPTHFRERDGNYRGTLYGVDEAHRPLGGLFPAPNVDPKLRNLFYCGGGVQPGAGLPMVTLSGRFAAEMASR